MRPLFRRLKYGRGDRTQPATFTTAMETIESSLEGRFRQIRDIDPKTLQQWQSLERAITRELDAGVTTPVTATRHPFRLAVSFAVLAAALLMVYLIWPDKSQTTTYQTGRGQLTAILLADGSEVTLNHTSLLTIEYRDFAASRRVYLKGEAFFRVHKNGTPFEIVTDIGRIQVVGTEFDVRSRESRLEVGVVAGTVKVTAERNGIDSSVVLDGGDLTTCVPTGYPQPPVRMVGFGYPGWMHGRMTFFRTTLKSACREIESTFDVVIQVENPRIQEETLTGVVDATSLHRALMTLTQLTGTTYRYENGVYILR
jgi:transmembrane sensor